MKHFIARFAFLLVVAGLQLSEVKAAQEGAGGGITVGAAGVSLSTGNPMADGIILFLSSAAGVKFQAQIRYYLAKGVQRLSPYTFGVLSTTQIDNVVSKLSDKERNTHLDEPNNFYNLVTSMRNSLDEEYSQVKDQDYFVYDLKSGLERFKDVVYKTFAPGVELVGYVMASFTRENEAFRVFFLVDPSYQSSHREYLGSDVEETAEAHGAGVPAAIATRESHPRLTPEGAYQIIAMSQNHKSFNIVPEATDKEDKTFVLVPGDRTAPEILLRDSRLRKKLGKQFTGDDGFAFKKEDANGLRIVTCETNKKAYLIGTYTEVMPSTATVDIESGLANVSLEDGEQAKVPYSKLRKGQHRVTMVVEFPIELLGR